MRWSRINFERLTMMVRVKAVNGRIGRLKTECSEDELPLDPDFAAVLLNWKAQCRQTIGDWVFPSHDHRSVLSCKSDSAGLHSSCC